MSFINRPLLCMSLCLSLVLSPSIGLAGQVDTLAFARNAPTDSTQTRLRDQFATAPARQAMLDLGVSPAVVEQRLQNLNPQELAEIERQLNEMPAGAGIASVVGVVFIVLIILELVGVTNIFTSF